LSSSRMSTDAPPSSTTARTSSEPSLTAWNKGVLPSLYRVLQSAPCWISHLVTCSCTPVQQHVGEKESL
jgi:hypothetical protein